MGKGGFFLCQIIVSLSNSPDQRTSDIYLKNSIYSSVGIYPNHSRNFKFDSDLNSSWRAEFLMSHQNNSFGTNISVSGLGYSQRFLAGIYSRYLGGLPDFYLP